MKNLKMAERESGLDFALRARTRLLSRPHMRRILMLTIRGVSDGTRGWHASNKFRSREVAKLTSHVSEKSAYHDFCNKNFSHEHVVPVSVIFEYIGNLKEPNHREILNILKRFCIAATITREEDLSMNRLGVKGKMPVEFYDENHELFDDPFARYKIAAIFDNLESRFGT